MVKRILSLLILISMVLHCSSRLGIISYLYSNRHTLANTLGITQEKHIATCDSNYFADHDLAIDTDHDDLPVTIVQADEINLFCVSMPAFNVHASFSFLNKDATPYLAKHYVPVCLDVLHPPA